MTEQEQILSVSQTIRILPEKGDHSDIMKVRGVISSIRPVFRMIAGEYGECPYCHTFYHQHYEKPLFKEPKFPVNDYCRNEDAIEHPVEFGKDENGAYSNEKGAKYDIIRDRDGKYVRTRVHLKVEYEYRNALIIDLQDEEKFDDLERLQVILFDEDTDNVLAGELVTITGQIYIETLNSSRDAKLGTRFYSHSIHYEARKEISISSVDRDAIRRFANEYGSGVVDKLVNMFATNVIGYQHVKKGLLISASSCANDYKSSEDFRYRVRIHCLLVGDPGTAKSLLLKAVTKVVPNSKFESAQSSTGISLTALVSKEGGDVSILRCGPIPLAKEAICALNEIGRMPFESQGQLLDVMEEGEFSVNKHGINAHIRSPTIIIGSANPTTSKWRIDGNDGKVNLDDIPAIKPLVDRFDLLFVFKSYKDPNDLREYTYKKSKSESSRIPNYDEFITKYLIYAKRFNPIISDEAETILNEYYIGIARAVDSPRVRDTLFRVARMVARLKLKNVVDAEDALEVCQFYNVVLNEHDQVVNIPANPRDVTLNECLYMLEATQAPITFEELIKRVCDKNQYIKIYIGDDLRIRANIKLRTILEMLLQNSNIIRAQIKPTVLQWVPTNFKSQEMKQECDPCDPCDSDKTASRIDNTTSNCSKQAIVLPTVGLMQQITGSQVSQLSHRPIPSIAYEAQVIRKILSNNERQLVSHVSHSDYDVEPVDKNITEIPMGLNRDWSIKRIGETGYTWLCDYPGCSASNGSNDITGSIGAIRGHALNHEIKEIQDKLERLSDLNLRLLLKELKMYSKDTLQRLQNHVGHGSSLERYLLEALDDIEREYSSTS